MDSPNHKVLDNGFSEWKPSLLLCIEYYDLTAMLPEHARSHFFFFRGRGIADELSAAPDALNEDFSWVSRLAFLSMRIQNQFQTGPRVGPRTKQNLAQNSQSHIFSVFCVFSGPNPGWGGFFWGGGGIFIFRLQGCLFSLRSCRSSSVNFTWFFANQLPLGAPRLHL